MALLLALASPAHADGDAVTLRNGDRLSGSIVEMNDETLVITTPYAKKVPVDRHEVVGIESTGPHWVRLKSGDYVQARFAPAPEGVALDSPDLVTRRLVPLDQIVTIGIAPGPQYHGSLGGLVSGTSGNTETLVVGASGEVRRETDQDRIVLGFRTEYEAHENADGDNQLTVQRTRGYGNYDYYLGPNWYLMGLGRLEHDRFQDLVLRTTVGGGPGYRFYDRKDLKLRVYGGLAYVNEDFRTAEDRYFVSGLLGDDFRWKVTPSFSVFQFAEVYPRLDDPSDTLFHVEAGVRQSLTERLFLEVAVVDDYDTEPAPDREKNDLRYLGQVGYQF